MYLYKYVYYRGTYTICILIMESISIILLTLPELAHGIYSRYFVIAISYKQSRSKLLTLRRFSLFEVMVGFCY